MNPHFYAFSPRSQEHPSLGPCDRGVLHSSQGSFPSIPKPLWDRSIMHSSQGHPPPYPKPLWGRSIKAVSCLGWGGWGMLGLQRDSGSYLPRPGRRSATPAPAAGAGPGGGSAP